MARSTIITGFKHRIDRDERSPPTKRRAGNRRVVSFDDHVQLHNYDSNHADTEQTYAVQSHSENSRPTQPKLLGGPTSDIFVCSACGSSQNRNISLEGIAIPKQLGGSKHESGESSETHPALKDEEAKDDSNIEPLSYLQQVAKLTVRICCAVRKMLITHPEVLHVDRHKKNNSKILSTEVKTTSDEKSKSSGELNNLTWFGTSTSAYRLREAEEANYTIEPISSISPKTISITSGSLPKRITASPSDTRSVNRVSELVVESGDEISSVASGDVSVTDTIHQINDTKVKIQLMSDLHLTNYSFTITPVASYLALLGDIGTVANRGYIPWLERHLPLFRKIFFLYGNNEAYESSWVATKTKMKKFQAIVNTRRDEGEEIGELIILDQGRFDFEDENLTVLGVTLHTWILREQKIAVSKRQEFYRTRNWDMAKHNVAHASDLAYLNTQVAEIARTHPTRRILILSHYSPSSTPSTIDPWIRAAVANKSIQDSGSGFFTNLSQEVCWRSLNVVCWAYGHTHFNVDSVDVKTGQRLVTNQAEDVRPRRMRDGFKFDFVLEV